MKVCRQDAYTYLSGTAGEATGVERKVSRYSLFDQVGQACCPTGVKTHHPVRDRGTMERGLPFLFFPLPLSAPDPSPCCVFVGVSMLRR